MIELNKIYNMDCVEGLKTLPDNCIDCCVTSPPYYALRDYGVDGQIGLEDTPQAYIDRLTDVFMQVYRVMKPQGTLWLNIGDSYWGGGGVTLPSTNTVEIFRKAQKEPIAEILFLRAKARSESTSRKT